MWIGKTKSLHNRKALRKTQKNNLLKTKRILKTKLKLSGGPGFWFSLPGGAMHSSDLPSVMPLLFTQYETTWLVGKRLCRLVEYVLIIKVYSW